MLEQIPQYHALSDEEQSKIVLRLIKAGKVPYAERGESLRREIDKIAAELRKRPEPAKA
jgi:hypothetical protein